MDASSQSHALERVANQLVSKLGDSDSTVAVLRAAIEQGCTEQLKDSLALFADARQMEIRAVCNEHYAEFIESVQDVLRMAAGFGSHIAFSLYAR